MRISSTLIICLLHHLLFRRLFVSLHNDVQSIKVLQHWLLVTNFTFATVCSSHQTAYFTRSLNIGLIANRPLQLSKHNTAFRFKISSLLKKTIAQGCFSEYLKNLHEFSFIYIMICGENNFYFY